ncbi:MAG: hypothetical protein QOI32_1538, partial [Thermoleophilaceae bacterium]|nr:hypothetical protein [Thermoleophilaceae bacterium]
MRGPRCASLLAAAVLLAAAAVPALADPGATASGGATAASEVVVKRGDRGNAVRSIQRQLGVSADGVFGAETDAAVRSYQSNHQLEADGVVGPRTWSSMFGPGGA